MGVVWLDQLTKLGKVDISALSSGARFMLFLYAEAADNNTGRAFPGTPRLMRLSGYGERQVQRYVQELRTAGFLELERNRGGRRLYATYKLRLERSAVPAESLAELQRLGVAPGDAAGGEGEAEHEDRNDPAAS